VNLVDVSELRVAGAPVTVRRHPRARRLRLRVDEAGALHLTLPPRASLRSARAFLDEQAEWIERALARVQAPEQRRGLFPLFGTPVPLLHVDAPRSSVRFTDALVVRAPTQQAAALALERWARRETLRLATDIVAREAPALGVALPRISVRGQRGRWGSASARSGTLALNWRLLLTTEAALDYVVVHELCHFVEMSHSPRFWQLVERTRPGYVEQKGWLRTHQAAILRWSPLAALAGAEGQMELPVAGAAHVFDARLRLAEA
jgi:predicted metal-dependent hydrolase